MDIALERAGRDLAILGKGGHASVLMEEFGATFDTRQAEFSNLPNKVWLIGIGCNVARKRIAEDLHARGVEFAYCNDGRRQYLFGTVILAGAHVSQSADIGVHCIINHLASVDHHATVENYAHIAPGARVLGGALVGEGALVGANAVVLPNAVVPDWKIVRAGSVYPADYNPKRRMFLKLRDNVAVTV